jgi:membrane protein DedA with SNARE-associated domain
VTSNTKPNWKQKAPLILIITAITVAIALITIDTLEDILIEGNPFSGTLLGNLLNTLATFTTNVTKTVQSWGYIGIFILMTLESSSLPIPSEIILPFAGYLVSQNQLNFWLIILISTIAGLAGSLIDYYIGLKSMDALMKHNTIRRLLFSKGRIETAEHLFVKYDAAAVFLSRLIPGFRTLVSFPAGAVKMPLTKFTAYTIAGCLFWNLALTYFGVYVGANWREVAGIVHYLIIAAAIAIIIVLTIFLIRRRNSMKKMLTNAATRSPN